MYSAASSHSSSVALIPRLRSTGRLLAPHGAEERAVLHVPRTNLEHVRVLGDEADGTRLEDLRHDGEVVAVGRRAQQAEPVVAEPLEAVGARPRLERSPPEEPRAGLRGRPCALLELLLMLDRAGPCDEHRRAAADGDAADRHYTRDFLRRALRHARVRPLPLEREGDARDARDVVTREPRRLDRDAPAFGHETPGVYTCPAHGVLRAREALGVESVHEYENHANAPARTSSSARTSTKNPTLTYAFMSKNALSILARFPRADERVLVHEERAGHRDGGAVEEPAVRARRRGHGEQRDRAHVRARR